jgi:hypothetical protein
MLGFASIQGKVVRVSRPFTCLLNEFHAPSDGQLLDPTALTSEDARILGITNKMPVIEDTQPSNERRESGNPNMAEMRPSIFKSSDYWPSRVILGPDFGRTTGVSYSSDYNKSETDDPGYR